MRLHYGIFLFCCAIGLAAFVAPDFPPLSGRVVDQAGLLSATTRAQLEAELAAQEARTTDQLVVVTVKSLEGRSIEEYGVALGRAWGIGQKRSDDARKAKDNGVLLLVAPQEHQVRIEVGYGLEGTLTDLQSSMIIRNTILPRFKAGAMEQGVVDGAEAILTVLNGGTPPPVHVQVAYAPVPQQDQAPGWMVFLYIAIILFVIVMRFRTGRGILALGTFGAGWSSGGGGFGGGGGFSGGGGSFGGGGSSGRW